MQNSLEPTRLNGNNVNLDEETLSHIDTTMRYSLAMLVDRTPPADVAATLHMDRGRVAKRTERVLGRLRRAAPRAAA